MNKKPLHCIFSCLLLLAVVLAYSNHFNNAFHFDDSHVLVQNVYVKEVKNIPLFFTDPNTKSVLPTNLAYRPMFMVTLAIDHWLGGGLDPFYFHLSTFIWFLVQGALLYFLFIKVLNLASTHRWNGIIAWLAVSWYMLHTANAETINYVSARTDSLTTLSVIMAFVIYIYANSWKKHLSYIPIVIGILIKPTPVMYLPLLFFYKLFFERRIGLSVILKNKNRKIIIEELVSLIPISVIAFGVFFFTLKMTPDSWVPGGRSLFYYLITQPFVILRYFWTFFIPLGLSADSDWVALKSIWDPRFIIGTIFLVLTLTISFLTSSSRKTSPIAFGLLWFLFSLVPSSSVIPLSEVTNDHRMFFPFVGLVLSVTWAIALLVIKFEHKFVVASWQKTLFITGIILILAGHGYGTYRRNEVWRTDESLWYDVSIKSPNNGRGLMNYGLSQMSKGRYEIALSYYKRALNTSYRNHPYLAINLGVVHEAMNRPEEAGKYFEKSIRIGSKYPECHYYYANWLQKNHRTRKAVKHLKTALELSPGHYRAQQLLDRIEQKVISEVQSAEALVDNNPTPENLLNLSLKYFNSEEFEKCIEVCEEALLLKPDFYQAYNNIGSAYIAMQRWSKGIEACEKALLINPEYELAKNNLRWAILQKEKSGH